MSADSQLINPLGGNKIVLVLITYASGTITLPTMVNETNCIDLGHLNQESFDTNSSESGLKNTLLQTVYTRYEQADTTEGIIMQRKKAMQDFLRYLVLNTFALQYHYQGIVGTKWQEELSIGQVVPQRNNQFPEGGTNFKYKFNKLPMDVATVISAANITAINAVSGLGAGIHMAGPATIAAGRYDILTETTVT